MGKTIFNQKWLVDYDWVRESKGDKRKALCYYCKKTLELSKMGESALNLKSHMKGEKHQFNYKSGKSVGQSVSGIQFYLSPTATTDLDPVSTTTRPSSSSSASSTINIRDRLICVYINLRNNYCFMFYLDQAICLCV